ncbi:MULTISPECIES: DUF6364 family protein [Salinibacter]|jgi:hypothetical protein|uniref:DUF6364 family protein n=1 Tax=Salinibacter TaxID=146918 RepID=UPI001ABAC6B3|nr:MULTISPECIES: DUF6364 family protein [Salinibacter]
MSKKLTLRLDEDVIERAKAYAADRDTSVSRLVEAYFAAVTETNGDRKQTSFSGTTRQFIGVLDEADEADYKQHLEEKYLDEST